MTFPSKRFVFPLIALIPLLYLLSGCRSMKPIATESLVDLNRFMGDWHVMANIPTFVERDAWNPLEHYELREDGVILTTFTFNKGGPDGPLKTYRPKGFVRDTETNAVWGMQFIWPFKAEYIVMYVDADYTRTVIGRRKRDYVWIMARDKHLPRDEIQALIDFAVAEGYDREDILWTPHGGVER